MSEHFEGFGGGDFGSRQNVYSGKPGSAESFLQSIPPELLQQLQKLAEFGLFGEGGIGQLMRSVDKQSALKRKRLSRGLRGGSVGRKLGARSGAIETFIANRVLAPSFEGSEAAYRDFLVQNQQSKLGGLSGIQDMLRFFQDQLGLEQGLEGPGFLDYVGPAVDIASIAAAPFTGGATLAIPAARRAGQTGRRNQGYPYETDSIPNY